MERGNPKRKFKGKIYTRATQGWSDRASALWAAKKMRDIGYRARVVFEARYYRIYWRG